MSTRPPQINIRISEKTKLALHQKAEENDRSVNAEIVARLQKSLEDEDREIEAVKNANEELQKIFNELTKLTKDINWLKDNK